MQEVLNTLKTVNEYIKSKSFSAEITYFEELSHLVRAGAGQISQNTTKGNSKFAIDLQKGKKKLSSSVACSPSDVEKVKNLANSMMEAISYLPELPYLTDMKPITQENISAKNSDDDVRNFNKEKIVDLFKSAASLFSNEGVDISGAFSAGGSSYAVINTLVDEPRYFSGSDFDVEVVLQLKNDSNKEIRASQTGENISHFNPNLIIEELKSKYAIKKNTQRFDLPPGEYDVVFFADALNEMLGGFSWLGLSGETYEYEMGMFNKSESPIGRKIFSDKFTLLDLSNDPDLLFKRPLGTNGIKRNAQTVIDKGVVQTLYYSDKTTCDQFGKTVNNDMGLASFQVATGDGPSTFDEVVKNSKKKTIIMTYLHYMNFTNRAKGEFTCTSRFGTYLAENGELKGHLYNLRLNDSFASIFSNIEWLSKDSTNSSASNTYGMRFPSANRLPVYTKINNVKITASSGSSAKKS